MRNSCYLAFVGTNAAGNSQGIYTVKIDAESSRTELLSTWPLHHVGTMDISRDRDVFYAGVETNTFQGYADGGVVGFSFDQNGSLQKLGAARSHGQRTCCVAVDSGTRNAYGANFYQGTMVKWPLSASGTPLEAEYVVDAPAPPGVRKALHCVKAIGDDYVGVISLTECALIIYAAADGRRITSFRFPGQPFPRYLEVCGDCLYAMMQDPGDIYVFKNRLDKDSSLVHLQTISVQREKLRNYGTTTIRTTPDGRFMLAATRAVNTLTVFRVLEDGRLEHSDIVELPGETPRDFAISRDGEIVVTCLQKSGEICVHRIDYTHGTLIDTGCRLAIPSPASVVVTERR